jgi:hypothetical protein
VPRSSPFYKGRHDEDRRVAPFLWWLEGYRALATVSLGVRRGHAVDPPDHPARNR